MSGASPLEIGSVVGDGRFAITGQLGAGSQAITYEAIDKRDGTVVALKQFSIRDAGSWKDVELAEREASVLASLNHRHLPRYLAHFEEDGALYLAMEKVEGKTLRVLRGTGFSVAEVVRFLNDSAHTLDYLHGHAPPIIHRDIKPSNVIRTPDGRFVLVDFGSVSHRLAPEGGSTVVGTFGYMAPEQFQGRALPATDTYAVAATALSMLAAEDPDTLPHKGLALDVEAALGPNFDKRLKGFLSDALVPDPDVRSRHTTGQLLDKHGLRLRAGEGHAPGTTPPGPRRNGQHGFEAGWERQQRKPNDEHPPVSSSDVHRGPFAAEERERVSAEGWSHPGDTATRDVVPFPGFAARFGLHHFPVFFAVLLGLWIARVSASIVMTLVLPLLLNILSLFLGPGLRRGAQHCLLAGRRAQRTLKHTTLRVHATARGEQPRRGGHRRRKVRVAQSRMRGFERGVEDLEREIEQAAREVERDLSTRRR